jgi:HSP20 family protein
MTYVKFNHAPVAKSFGGLVEEIFNGANKFIKDDFNTADFFGAHPAVNIYESKEAYTLDLLVPGLNKEDFKISLDNKVLTISAEKAEKEAEATKDESQKQIRREFSYRSFKRSFTLNEQVDATKIQAKYENGILKVTLSKKENIQDPVKAIVVE